MHYNVLPEEVKKELRTKYRYRRTATGLFALSLVLVVASFALTPALVVIRSKEAQARDSIANASGSLGSTAAASAAAIDFLRAKVSALSSPEAQVLPSEVIRLVLTNAPKGVSISSVEIDSAGSGKLSVSGIADTRAELVAYQNALKATPPFSGADLPVSLLAKDTNVSFTLTVTGSF